MTPAQLIRDRTVDILLQTDPAERSQVWTRLLKDYVTCLDEEYPNMSDREIARNAAGYALAVRARMQEITTANGVTQIGHA
jgi:hypothetical protein